MTMAQPQPRADNATRAFELALIHGKFAPLMRCDGCKELIKDGNANLTQLLACRGFYSDVRERYCKDTKAC